MWAIDAAQPDRWLMRDKPGIQHGRAATLSFADGHVEVHRWQEARTLSAPRNDAPMPGNRDVLWLQEHATWRER